MFSRLRIVAALLGGTVVASAAAPAAPVPPPADADALVVGAGIAGLSAAWELARGGARVIVVDAASVFGGHAVMSEGILCVPGTPDQAAKGIKDSPDLAYRDFVTWGEDPNLAWVRTYVDRARPEIYDWLAAMGVTFDSLLEVAGNSAIRQHRTKGRGLALVSPIYRQCVSDPRIRFVWNTRVDQLVVSDGRVAGVQATSARTGATLALHAPAVLLATGGFQSNLELVRKNWPTGLAFPDHLLVGSGFNSLGSGLTLASAVGARLERLDHQWNYITGLPDPRYPGSGRGLNSYNTDGIWVNAAGRRFITERLSHKQGLPILLRQPGGTYWSIFDEPAKRGFFVSGSNWGNFEVIEQLIFGNPDLVKSAGTLAELAARAGLPPAPLAETVAHFNAMVDRGVDADFGLFGPGISYQPRKISTPPFYAVQYFPVTRKSMGGVAIDTAGRVQDGAARPINGLYAAGEVTGLAGINGKAGLEGTFLGPSILTGRVAGRTILADQGKAAGTGPVGSVALPPPPRTDPRSSLALCLSCHDLPKLVATPRPGFWHFEKVHRRVTAEGRDCATCHAELTPPYERETHRIDRLAQVQVCAACHQAQ